MSIRTRVAGSAIAAVALTALAATAASAHVTVSSPDASAGGYGKLVFRVPTESDSASTVKVVVQLPTDTPFASVSPKVMPGWTVVAKTSKLDQPLTDDDGNTISEAVSSVTWTADGDGIPSEQFDEFELSVGPFPEDVTDLSFPTVQTYSDGTVVKWNETSVGGAEAEHPAPELSIAPSGSSEEPTSTDKTASLVEGGASGGSSSEDTTARALGIAALVASILAIGAAFVLGRRTSG